MNRLSTHAPRVKKSAFCPTEVIEAAFGLEDAEAAAPLAEGDADPLGNDPEEGLALLLAPSFVPSQLTNGHVELDSVERVE